MWTRLDGGKTNPSVHKGPLELTKCLQNSPLLFCLSWWIPLPCFIGLLHCKLFRAETLYLYISKMSIILVQIKRVKTVTIVKIFLIDCILGQSLEAMKLGFNGKICLLNYQRIMVPFAATLKKSHGHFPAEWQMYTGVLLQTVTGWNCSEGIKGCLVGIMAIQIINKNIMTQQGIERRGVSSFRGRQKQGERLLGTATCFVLSYFMNVLCMNNCTLRPGPETDSGMALVHSWAGELAHQFIQL